MKADKTFSGVTPDHGTILRVNERVTSDSTAALKESLSIYDSYYMGGHLRPVRRAVFVDRPMFGMSMMANNVPLLEIALSTALQSFKPYEDLLAFDEVLSTMGGASRAPSVTIQPATTVLANGYKFADTLVESQNAWYDNRANWLSSNEKNHISSMKIYLPNVVTGKDFKLQAATRTALPRIAPYTTFPRVVLHGLPTMPVQDPYDYRNPGDAYEPFKTYLLPIEGQGPEPFLAVPGATKDGSVELSKLIPLRWGIFYQEQDVEIQSPVKKLAMIAYLNHLFDYLDGVNPGLGQYNWPDPQGGASAPYTPTSIGHTGHHIINNLLLEVARAAALRLEYLTAEQLPSSTELQVIRAIANLLYFLDHRELLIKALCNASDIRQFLTMLLESQLVNDGVDVEFLDARNGIVGPEASGTDFQSGIFPAEATDFFWREIVPLLPDDVFDNQLLSDLVAGTMVTKAETSDEYERIIKDGLISNVHEDPASAMRWIAMMTAHGTSAVKHMNVDMRADYVAAAILARLKESLPLVCSLLKGEIAGFEHLHTNERVLSLDVAVNILQTIEVMVTRDLVSDPSVLEWEEPFTGARYSTQWQSYSVRFPVYPIQYVVHDAARDCLAEIKMLSADLPSVMTDKDAPLKQRAELINSVTSAVQQAFKTLGISLIQCEPVMSFVALSPRVKSESAYVYMAGERQLNGTKSSSSRDVELYGDVNVSHGALKVTSTYYVRSATIWNQILEMPHQVTARANNPQPVPKLWHAYAVMKISTSKVAKLMHRRNSALAEAILNVQNTSGASSFRHVIDLNPAFRDIAVVCPYVQMLVQTPPEAYAFSMMSKISFEADQKICNIAGTPIVLDRFVPAAGVAADQMWRMPNLATQMAYTATPITHLILPLIWNAVR